MRKRKNQFNAFIRSIAFIEANIHIKPDCIIFVFTVKKVILKDMAIISMFYGIIVSMYYLDNRKHNLPHIHVKYQVEEAVISIIDGQLLDGTLKINKMKLVQAWIEIHNDELMADWELAIKGETIFKIDPLK